MPNKERELREILIIMLLRQMQIINKDDYVKKSAELPVIFEKEIKSPNGVD